MNRFRFLLLTGLFLAFSLFAHAARERVLVSRCGKTGFMPIVSTATGTSLSIEDQWYSYMFTHPYTGSNPWDEIFRVKSANVRVSLRYDDDRHYVAIQPWAIRVTYDITTNDSDGTSHNYTGEQLLITYDPANGTTYTDLAMKSYSDSHKAKIGIRSVEYWSDGNLANASVSTIPANLKDVYLDLESDVERFYKLDAAAPVLQPGFNIATTNVSLGWNYILGAESYDVEWLFIDAGTASLSDPAGFDYDWKNATRVNVPAQQYTIELAYPRGIVLMRVRPVGIDFRNYISTGNIVRADGSWSYGVQTGNTDSDAAALTAANARQDISTGREASINWQYNASFAEDGKKKETIGFYDGSLYNRQGITRVNTDTNLVVAETRYDFEGRPAVQLLPTPLTPDVSHPDVMQYQRDFNPGFDRNSFDTDTRIDNPDPLDTTFSATGKFYSGNNTATDRGKAYTATANGYAYSEVQYKSDGTNRPSRQSGVGQSFRQGNGHDIEYFYGTPTGQVELDRLFGNEVGYVKHYQKNLVVDPNGQVSVSYLDQEGRVIASALAGDVPDNLLPLIGTDYDPKPLTADLLGNNELTNNQMVSYSTITVSGTTDYSFTYDLGGDTACGKPCYPVCSDCRYDLEIRVEKEDFSLVTPLSGTNPIIATNIASGNYTFSMQLPVGVYRVKKILSLNAGNLQTLKDAFITAQNTGDYCISTVTPQAEPCAYDCHEACEQLYKSPDGNGGWLYYDATGEQITGNDMNGHTPAQQAQTLIDACKLQLCDQPPMPDPCALKYHNMWLDMSPKGQYFDNTPSRFTVDANGNLVPAAGYYSILPPASYVSGHINDWLDHHPFSSVMLNAINTAAGTGYTNWDQVRSHWDTSWATILVKWHPEYCTWNYYCGQSCTASTGPNPLDVVILGEPQRFAYDQLFFYSTTGNYPATSSGSEADLELFNPTNLILNNVTNHDQDDDHHNYQPINNSTYNLYADPSMACDFTICEADPVSAIGRLNFYLENFLPLYDNTNTLIANKYHSIWYVIDDPDNIHSSTPSASGLSQNTIDFYVALHGDGTTGSTGLLTTAGGTITPFQFFAGNYSFFRQLVIDQGYLASSEVARCQGEHAGAVYHYLSTVPGERPVTADGYTVYFPENPALAAFGDGCTPLAMADLLTAISDNVTDIETTYNTEANTLPDAPVQQVCSCENLNQFIINNDLSDELAASNFQAIADALNAVLAPSILNSGNYTATEVSNWITTCGETTFTMEDLTDDNFPPDLSCPPAGDPGDLSDELALLQSECNAENDALGNANASAIFNGLVSAAAEDYINHYTSACLAKLKDKETFTVEYELKEYQYTLYYYDQAGNLVKTVPPEGVRIIDLGADALNSNGTDDGTDIVNYRNEVSGSVYTPALHGMITDYKYNSMQAMRTQIAPDVADTSKFYYDDKGRLILSQNIRQRTLTLYPTPAWSYTLYDALGRPYESGQVINATALPNEPRISQASFATWMSAATAKQQVVHTQYDEPISGVAALFPDGVQLNIRGRVASVTYEAVDDGNVATWDNASHYSYDIHGNVNVLVQDNHLLADGPKVTTYEYDLVSGNVNAVHYQTGEYDEFNHRYEYDADNRMTIVYSSRDGVVWEKEAKNFYYATGPLQREETGDKIVQGNDYAYTAQGWIKGMNAGSINAQRDIGQDAYADYITGKKGQNRDAGLDAGGYVLGYFDGTGTTKNDYWAPAFAAQSTAERFIPVVSSTATQADYKSLYNGNIAYMVTSLTDQNQSVQTNQLTAYQYDQLNRIKLVHAHRNFNATNNAFEGATGDDGKYLEAFLYDHNGNIGGVERHGNHTGTTQWMDDFTYYYYDQAGGLYSGAAPLNATNRLAYVDDGITSSNYTTDIDNQTSATNYEYDGLGNLTSDESEEIANIDWYANGKIKSITRNSSSTKSDLEFIYDAMGNRLVKIVKPRDGSGIESQLHWTYTFYSRDAQGNVLAVYDRTFEPDAGPSYFDKLKLSELDIYGSKRVGLLFPNEQHNRLFTDGTFTDVDGAVFSPTYSGGGSSVSCTDHCVNDYLRTLGNKAYEITNHLGNVLETVSDRKLAVDNYSYSASAGGNYKYDATLNVYYAVTAGTGTHNRVTASSDLKADWYTADVLSYSDYYAFGAQMDGRFGGSAYRYDFNGKETDKESDLQDYGMRIYNARLGKFLSVDPMAAKYAMYSPYEFAGDMPIECIDVFGAGPIPATVAPPPVGNKVTFEQELEELLAQNKIIINNTQEYGSNSVPSIGATVWGVAAFCAFNLSGDNTSHLGEEMVMRNKINTELIGGFEARFFTEIDANQKALERIYKGTGTAQDFTLVNSVYRLGITEWLKFYTSSADGLIQNHHLIPQQWKKHEVVQAAIRAGYQFDGDQNLLPLLRYRTNCEDETNGTHSNHPSYNTYVFVSLEAWVDNHPGYTDQMAYDYINQLSGYLRGVLMFSPDKVNDVGKKLLEEQGAPVIHGGGKFGGGGSGKQW